MERTYGNSGSTLQGQGAGFNAEFHLRMIENWGLQHNNQNDRTTKEMLKHNLHLCILNDVPTYRMIEALNSLVARAPMTKEAVKDVLTDLDHTPAAYHTVINELRTHLTDSIPSSDSHLGTMFADSSLRKRYKNYHGQTSLNPALQAQLLSLSEAWLR